MKTPRWIKRLFSSLVIGGQAVSFIAKGRCNKSDLSDQMMEAGPASFLIVLITGISAGTVFNIQVAAELSRQGLGSEVGGLLAIGLAREIAPLLTATLLTGKVATAYAAQLGTMKVTEQIDALKTLSADPISYLIIPRIISGIIMLPILIIFADIIGIMGGWFIGTQSLGFNGSVYIQNTIDFLEINDISSGLIKASFFGLIITIMGCYQGFSSSGGAQGVGKATTNAVVSASILILASNYIMTNLFFTA